MIQPITIRNAVPWLCWDLAAHHNHAFIHQAHLQHNNLTFMSTIPKRQLYCKLPIMYMTSRVPRAIVRTLVGMPLVA